MVSLWKPTMRVSKKTVFDFKMRVYGMKHESFFEIFSFLLYNIYYKSVGGGSNEIS